MPSKSASIAACGVLFLLLLLGTAPARLVGHLLPANQLYAQGFSGTLWQGSASSAAVALPGGWFELGELKWSLSPVSLAWLSPRIELQSQWGQQRIDADISVYPDGSVTLHEISSSLSASLVQQFLPIQVRGQLDLLASGLEVVDGVPAAGQGRLVWQRGYWIGNSGGQALGDYVVEFALSGPAQASAEVSTLSGPVSASGSLDVDGRRYSINLLLSSESGFSGEIANALQLMAAPVEGGYRLQFSSEI